jgi:GNAT superfamily N-acetyltransferase
MKRTLESPSSFPPPGEDDSIWLAEQSLCLRYGTSLRLISSGSGFLNSTEEFAEIDPEADWEKWRDRCPGHFTLFYAAIVDPIREGPKAIHCVLRAVLDNWPTPTAPHNARLIIDYVACRRESRGRGFATQLVDFVREASAKVGANCYVLALEEACPYWVDRGFVLEQSENLNARLNIFPDVHLLRVEGDPIDVGSADDLALAQEEEEEAEENDDDEEGDGDGDGEGEGEGGGEDGGDMDEDLQAALAMSLAEAPAAVAVAVASERPPPAGSTRAHPVDVIAEDGGGGSTPEEEEERAMQEAIRLSLQQ